MMIYNTLAGLRILFEDKWYLIDYVGWDELVGMESMFDFLLNRINQAEAEDQEPTLDDVVPPVGNQEIWAAGVTYFKSRTARMEESKASGGSDFYDRVYNAERPELFMKSTAHRVKTHLDVLSLRKDSAWMVPEPELTLLISPAGRIQGYTIGNDLSSRDIEGENPLYLPQAKTFDGCISLGPGVFLTNDPFDEDKTIKLKIIRRNQSVFEGDTNIGQMKKKPASLVDYLYHSLSFPVGCYLMTGTGIVPPDDFSLKPDDEIHITIDSIGTLINTVQ